MKSKLPILILMGTMLVSSLMVLKANAQYELKEITPAVKSALEGRRDRFSKLSELKAKIVIGENNTGYVTLLSDDAMASKLVDSENQDRVIIYKAIASQNNISDQLNVIEKVFAQVQREKANTGERVQLENGEWITK